MVHPLRPCAPANRSRRGGRAFGSCAAADAALCRVAAHALQQVLAQATEASAEIRWHERSVIDPQGAFAGWVQELTHRSCRALPLVFCTFPNRDGSAALPFALRGCQRNDALALPRQGRASARAASDALTYNIR